MDALLRELVAKNLSYAQIATGINRAFNAGVSRNSALGRAFRLGLATRKATYGSAVYSGNAVSKLRRQRSRQEQTPAAPKFPTAPLPPPADYDKPAVNLLDLEPCQCRWPVGDPKHQDFGFCGQEAHPGQSYCDVHTARAIQPVTARTERAHAFVMRRMIGTPQRVFEDA